MASKWYPSGENWIEYGSYKVRYKYDSAWGYTDVLVASGDYTDVQARNEHIHICQIGTENEHVTYKDKNGRLLEISNLEMKQLLEGASPIIYQKYFT